MEGLNLLFLILAIIFLLRNGVISQGPIPSPEDLSEAKLERKQAPTQLLELNSYLESLLGSVSGMATRVKNIQRLLTTTEATLVTTLGVSSAAAYMQYRSYKKSGTEINDLEAMLKDPKASFFKGENLTGEAVNYDSSNTTYTGGCHEVDGIKSMRISKSCVRVFKRHNCTGISRALYPKRNSGSFINFFTPELPFVRSVGPCLPSEFQFVTVSLIGSRIAVTKDESNVRQVPDFFYFYDVSTFVYKFTSISSNTNPVELYYMDQGRPKWIYAWIFKRHLKSNMGVNSGMNMAIPLELGGPRNEVYNTFSQTRKNFEEWKRITDEVVASLEQSWNAWTAVRATVTFVYETPSAPNPFGFYYWIDNSAEKIMYGFNKN